MPGWSSLCVGLFLVVAAAGPKQCDETAVETKDPPKSVRCEPGESRSCTCPGDNWGVQYCEVDGTGYGKCDCRSPLDNNSHIEDAILP